MVVCGADGMDEISFTGDTYVAELKNGQVQEYVLNPGQFGLPLHALSSIQVADAQASKQMILNVFAGQAGPARDIVLLNAGAAIYVAGLADTLEQGVDLAATNIDNGQAMQKLDALIAMSNRVTATA
jgi:anthranilate phosphoribosyltransferase